MIEAKYTMLYKDWLDHLNPRELGQLIMVTNGVKLQTEFRTIIGDNDMADDLLAMLYNIFAFYEIGSDEESHNYLSSEFKDFITTTCHEYAAYYKEVITNYRKEYDYALNNKRVMYKTDELNMVGNTKIDTQNNGSSTDYQLPNKVVDEERYRSTPSSITDNDNKGSSDKKYDNNTTRISEHTTEFNNEFIDLKNKYMNQIRNVYREFAMKFKDCFYQIY